MTNVVNINNGLIFLLDYLKNYGFLSKEEQEEYRSYIIGQPKGKFDLSTLLNYFEDFLEDGVVNKKEFDDMTRVLKVMDMNNV